MSLCVSRLANLMGAAKTVAAMTDATAMNEKRICVCLCGLLRESRRVNGRARIGLLLKNLGLILNLLSMIEQKLKMKNKAFLLYKKKMELTFNNEKCEMNVSVAAQYTSSRSKS